MRPWIVMGVVAGVLLALVLGYFVAVKPDAVQAPSATGGMSPRIVDAPAGQAPERSGDAGEVEAVAVPATADGAALTIAPMLPPPSTPTTLPPEGLPLSATYPALLAAHRAGDRAASVRLRRELSECERFRFADMRMDMMLAFEEQVRGGRREDRLQEMLAATAETVADLGERCAQLPEDFEQALLFEVQLAAAEAGDLAGQLAFALFPALNQSRALRQMERLQTYRAHAGSFLMAALQQGSGQAVAALIEAHEWRPEMWGGRAGRGTEMQRQTLERLLEELGPLTPLQQVMGQDLVKAYTYALLCQRACGGTDVGRADEAVQRIGAQIDAADRRRAQADARALYDRHFAGRPRAAEVDLIALRETVRAFGPAGRRGRGG